MPEPIAAALREIGPRIEPGRTAEIYAPLHGCGLPAGVSVLRDRPYGPHERNVLDVFSATSASDGPGHPVLVFVHGGGFQRGDKTLPGLPFYDNVMRWAVGQGIVGANMSYRLAPEYRWPSGIEDVAGAVAWLRANVAAHGGDPARIYLWGHSAGAAHVADYVAWRIRERESPGVAGAILTSGFYELGDEASAWQVYYGDDVASYAERSSLAGLVASGLPLLVNDAELDPEIFRAQSRLLVDSRARVGRPVRYLHLLGHSHISETYAVGTDDTTLSDAVREFLLAPP